MMSIVFFVIGAVFGATVLAIAAEATYQRDQRRAALQRESFRRLGREMREALRPEGKAR